LFFVTPVFLYAQKSHVALLSSRRILKKTFIIALFQYSGRREGVWWADMSADYQIFCFFLGEDGFQL